MDKTASEKYHTTYPVIYSPSLDGGEMSQSNELNIAAGKNILVLTGEHE